MATAPDSSFLPKITAFLLDFLYFAIDWLYNAVIDIINALILVIGTFITSIVSLFPGNPCASLIANCSEAAQALTAPPSALWAVALQAIAWLLPMTYLVNLVGCAMTSIMIYFLIAPLMRWAKLIT